jgi:hypothetical protein
MTASKHWNGHSGPVLDSVNGFDVIECAVCDFNHVVPTGSAEDAIQQGVLTNAIHKCSTRPDVKASPSNFA